MIFKVGDDYTSIANSARRFLDQQDRMDHRVHNVFAGHLRAIVGNMTVEEMIRRAEGEAVRARGMAEAEAIQARAKALSENQDAVIGQQLTERWPAVIGGQAVRQHRPDDRAQRRRRPVRVAGAARPT